MRVQTTLVHFCPQEMFLALVSSTPTLLLILPKLDFSILAPRSPRCLPDRRYSRKTEFLEGQNQVQGRGRARIPCLLEVILRSSLTLILTLNPEKHDPRNSSALFLTLTPPSAVRALAGGC